MTPGEYRAALVYDADGYLCAAYVDGKDPLHVIIVIEA
jgi:hypothetical protein